MREGNRVRPERVQFVKSCAAGPSPGLAERTVRPRLARLQAGASSGPVIRTSWRGWSILFGVMLFARHSVEVVTLAPSRPKR